MNWTYLTWLQRFKKSSQRRVIDPKPRMKILNISYPLISIKCLEIKRFPLYLMKTIDVPADSTVVLEKPINLGAGDKLETQASADDDVDVFASIS